MYTFMESTRPWHKGGEPRRELDFTEQRGDP
jgi:hypothetical protein